MDKTVQPRAPYLGDGPDEPVPDKTADDETVDDASLRDELVNGHRDSIEPIEQAVQPSLSHDLLEAAVPYGMRWAALGFVFSVPGGALYLHRHHDALGPGWVDLAPHFVSFFIVTGLLAGTAVAAALELVARTTASLLMPIVAAGTAGLVIGWGPGSFAAGYFGGMALPMWEPDMVVLCVCAPLTLVVYMFARSGGGPRLHAWIGTLLPLVALAFVLLPFVPVLALLTSGNLDLLRDRIIEIGPAAVGAAAGSLLFALHGAWAGIAVTVARVLAR